MSNTAQKESSDEVRAVARVDMKFEVVVIPVSDVGPARRNSTGKLGWRLDGDFRFRYNGFPRGPIQRHLAQPARSSSARRLRRPHRAQPKNLYLVVSDIEAAAPQS